jgi:hypothetical protein
VTAATAPEPVRELVPGVSFPEGPVALSDGSVQFVEIGAGRVTIVAAGKRARALADVGGGPNGAAIGPDGAVSIANNGGFLWTEREGRRIPIDPVTHTNEPPNLRVAGSNGLISIPEHRMCCTASAAGGHCGGQMTWSLMPRVGCGSPITVRADTLQLTEGACTMHSQMARISFPGDVTTNVCFRDPSMQQAVVTLSGSGRIVEIDWPRPGLELAFSL